MATASLVGAADPLVGIEAPSPGADTVVTESSQRLGATLGPAYRGYLSAVDASSPSDVWTGAPAQHFDGTSWSKVPYPQPGGFSFAGISAVSADDAWLSGTDYSGPANRTVIEHWDGTAWTRVPSPSPGAVRDRDSNLYGIDAVAADDAWAVGDFSHVGDPVRTLIEHWNGRNWTQVPSPSPNKVFGQGNYLRSVSAVSATDAWAVGWYHRQPENVENGLIVHWDGTEWTRTPFPSPGYRGRRFNLYSVSAVSANDVWAVGGMSSYWDSEPISLHWDGTDWSLVPVPSGRADEKYGLYAVSATSATDAWAVGTASRGSTGRTLTLHWDGERWSRTPSPSPHPDQPLPVTQLAGVSAVTPDDAWTVGGFEDGVGAYRTLLMHWDGTSWTRF